MLGRSERVKNEGQLVELVSDESPSSKAPPRSERGWSKDVRRGAIVREAMEKSWCVWVIGKKQVIGNDPIKYFLPIRVRSTF